MNDYEIKKLYEEMELHLIQSMKRNFGRHLTEENEVGFKFTQWQAEKLKELKRYQRENKKIIGRYTLGLDKEVSEHLQNELKQGSIAAIKQYNKALGDKLKPSKVMNKSFFKTNDRKVNVLIKVVNNDLKTANTSALRMANDQYRQIIHKSAFFVGNGVFTEKQAAAQAVEEISQKKLTTLAVDEASKNFLAGGLNCIEYSDGRRVNIASYAQMAVRTASLRTHLMGEGNFRASIGRTLVKVTTHGGACKLCTKWQGKVLVDDVYSGGKPDGKHTLLSEAMAQGFLHPNCRHGITTYYPELEEDDEIIEPVTPKQEETQQALNYAVKNVKKYRRLEKGSLDPNNVEKYSLKRKQWTNEAKELDYDLEELKKASEQPLDTSKWGVQGSRRIKPEISDVEYGNKTSNIKFNLPDDNSKFTNTIKENIEKLANEYKTPLESVGYASAKETFRTGEAGSVTNYGRDLKIGQAKIETIYHEFAHTLADEQRYKLLGENKEFWEELTKIRKDYYKEVRAIDKRALTDKNFNRLEALNNIRLSPDNKYFETSIDEFFAEGFTYGKLGGTNSPYASRIVELTDKYFKKDNTKTIIPNYQMENNKRHMVDSEVKKLANKMDNVVSKHTNNENKWSKKIVISNNENAGKLWSCDIRISNNTLEQELSHELLHARSISHFDADTFVKYMYEEEATVEMFNKQMLLKDKIPYYTNGYSNMVECLEEISDIIGKDRYEFAQELFNVKVIEREKWLKEQFKNNPEKDKLEELLKEAFVKW